MAKEKKLNIPAPLYFSAKDIEVPSEHYNRIEAQAKDRYRQLKEKGCFADMWLIQSAHWSGMGFWIVFKLPNLSNLDVIMSENHIKNPKPWIPPAPNEPDEDEGEEDE